MKNLSFENISMLNEKNVLEYLYSMYAYEMQSLQDNKLCALTSFQVCGVFAFRIYAPIDIPISETEKVKTYIFETIGKSEHLSNYIMLNIRKDDRFAKMSWRELFSDEWGSSGVITRKQLLEVMSFVARLYRLRAFE